MTAKNLTSKVLTRTCAVFALAMLCLESAHAHQVRFEGGIGSGAAILTEGFIANSDQVSGIEYVQSTGHEATVSREDETTHVSCFKAYFAYSCKLTMKHGRPLADLESYPIGKDMTIEGAVNSNSSLIVKILKTRAAVDASISSAQRGTRSFTTRQADDLSLSCSSDAGNDNSSSSCTIVTK